MTDVTCIPDEPMEAMSASARNVLAHVCEGDCHTFGSVISWCEARGDCTHLVTCPGCGERWVVDDDDLTALERWTEANGGGFSCGVHVA